MSQIPVSDTERNRECQLIHCVHRSKFLIYKKGRKWAPVTYISPEYKRMRSVILTAVFNTKWKEKTYRFNLSIIYSHEFLKVSMLK